VPFGGSADVSVRDSWPLIIFDWAQPPYLRTHVLSTQILYRRLPGVPRFTGRPTDCGDLDCSFRSGHYWRRMRHAIQSVYTRVRDYARPGIYWNSVYDTILDMYLCGGLLDLGCDKYDQ
jgi:hypothetical protein